ncbi:MAG TPA: hypothetical protein VNV82_01615 [Bryobacteraceae bacterium]|nr:hypothetical protein [Bryobacteraceae bacterium]
MVTRAHISGFHRTYIAQIEGCECEAGAVAAMAADGTPQTAG